MAKEHVAARAAWPPEVDAAAAVCVDERDFRRRIANRESARRSRARKLRHLEELRDSAGHLERENRDLAGRVQAAHTTLALALLANDALRAEATTLSRRLAAASQGLVHGRLYNAGADDAAVSIDDVAHCSVIGSTNMEEMIASLIMEPPPQAAPALQASMYIETVRY